MAIKGIRTAFVLGAGLGTRLRPLTEHRPKPLVPVAGRPLIAWCFDHLIAAGIERFVVNTHYLPKAFDRFFPTVNGATYNGRPVTFVHEPDLLETGGGILNAAKAIGDEPFLVCSGDVLTTLDIGRLIDVHLATEAVATLAARKTGLASHLALRGDNLIDIKARFGHVGTHDFANVSVWNPGIFERIPAGQKISFVPVLLDWMAAGAKAGAAICDDGIWFNIGSEKEYFDVHAALPGGPWIDPTAKIGRHVKMVGSVAVGPGSAIGDGCVLRDTLIWDNAAVAPGCHLNRRIVRDGEKISV